jgi:hypothetical protein
MDFSIKTNKNLTPYWALSFSKNNTNNPIFLDEINFSKIYSPDQYNYSWTKFLKSNTHNTTNTSFTLKPLTQGSLVNDYETTTNYSTENLVNINFLRYERLYTKLKYSRSPAFDIVSGGAAALLAGFLGFLISEKFGFELVDSGDFYYLFMYVVFASFMFKPFLYIINVNESILNSLSPRNTINFFSKITLVLFKLVKLFK